MENAQEYGALSKEVALHLNINPNTLRRWSLELEKHGYHFERNNKGQRIYYERDLRALSECKMILEKGQSMENATKAIASRFIEQNNAQKTLGVILDSKEDAENITLSKRDLESIVESAVMKAMENERETLLEAIQLKMTDTIEQRDRLLMQQLSQKVLVETEEKTAANERRSIFSWLKKKR
ncbi:MerR family transcriptional regulator [Domibacillus enclensis]|uniref:DNA-binding protein n=1 Tax=Domibacillus enclensis TaxID=1017273 RepID=A0A1N7D0T2_9BACI|nr:MerR family transcriptional regulator [Domibacillus enclensis]OXS72953.1 DNA-binding protein [Domibacillus enclensis]SIR69400.1 MerR HTH family regulatory protein [Domibacillus enclensis]